MFKNILNLLNGEHLLLGKEKLNPLLYKKQHFFIAGATQRDFVIFINFYKNNGYKEFFVELIHPEKGYFMGSTNNEQPEWSNFFAINQEEDIKYNIKGSINLRHKGSDTLIPFSLNGSLILEDFGIYDSPNDFLETKHHYSYITFSGDYSFLGEDSALKFKGFISHQYTNLNYSPSFDKVFYAVFLDDKDFMILAERDDEIIFKRLYTQKKQWELSGDFLLQDIFKLNKNNTLKESNIIFDLYFDDGRPIDAFGSFQDNTFYKEKKEKDEIYNRYFTIGIIEQKKAYCFLILRDKN